MRVRCCGVAAIPHPSRPDMHVTCHGRLPCTASVSDMAVLEPLYSDHPYVLLPRRCGAEPLAFDIVLSEDAERHHQLEAVLEALVRLCAETTSRDAPVTRHLNELKLQLPSRGITPTHPP